MPFWRHAFVANINVSAEIVPLLVIGPPFNPLPVATEVTNIPNQYVPLYTYIRLSALRYTTAPALPGRKLVSVLNGRNSRLSIRNWSLTTPTVPNPVKYCGVF